MHLPRIFWQGLSHWKLIRACFVVDFAKFTKIVPLNGFGMLGSCGTIWFG
jgi:hypothetical protein